MGIMSFRCRIWMAMLCAATCAGGFVGLLLTLFSYGAAGAAAGGGVVPSDKTDEFQAYLMLGLELYLFPRVYEAVAASRDEHMYTGIVSKASALGSRAQRLVVVVGAAHANGILQRARARG